MQLIPFRRGSKWGYSTPCPNCEIKIECKYESAKPFIDGRAFVRFKSLWGVIDENGCWIVKPKYDGVKPFSEGMAPVLKNGKTGFINLIGEEVIPLIYDDVDSFKNGFAPIKKNSKHGVVSKSGVEIIPCISDRGIRFSEGLAAVSLIDESGKPNLYTQSLEAFQPQSFSITEMESRVVYVDSNGNEFDPDELKESLKNHRYGYVDAEGVLQIPLMYEVAFDFSEGLAVVCLNGKFGFINQRNEWAIPNIYDDAYDFHDGLARVRKDGLWGYISKDGNVVIDFQFKECYDFHEGWAKVVVEDNALSQGERIRKRECFIDKQGKEQKLGWYPDPDDPDFYEPYETFGSEAFSDGLIAAAGYGTEFCYINKYGNAITARKYVSSNSFVDNLALVELKKGDGEWDFAYMDTSGNEYWEDEINVTINDFSVKIGSQEWSLMNLNVEKFRNGDMIPQAQTDEEWEQMARECKPAWCYHPLKYRSDVRHGKLYNWYALVDERGLAPDGWRLPSYEDWRMLTSKLGIRAEVMLKSSEWSGTNESGFNALPSGARCGPDTIPYWEFQGSEGDEYTALWSFSESNPDSGVCILFGDLVYMNFLSESKGHGLSVRLIKEQ